MVRLLASIKAGVRDSFGGQVPFFHLTETVALQGALDVAGKIGCFLLDFIGGDNKTLNRLPAGDRSRSGKSPQRPPAARSKLPARFEGQGEKNQARGNGNKDHDAQDRQEIILVHIPGTKNHTPAGEQEVEAGQVEIKGQK